MTDVYRCTCGAWRHHLRACETCRRISEWKGKK